MIDRRRLLASAAAMAGMAGSPLPALAQAAMAAGTEDARLDALLTRQFHDNLERLPEEATALGLDVGDLYSLKSRLAGRSVADVEAGREADRRHLAELRTIDASALSPEAKLNHEVFTFVGEVAVESAAFPWHTTEDWRRTPYVVSQIGGAYVEIPSFLESNHPVDTVADADAFLSRLEAFAVGLDGDTERSATNAGMEVVAPDFVLDKAIMQLTALRSEPGAQQAMIKSLAKQMTEKSVTGDHVARAERLFDGPVSAALERQIAELTRQRATATHDAGVGRLKDGDAYYALNLKAYTTTDYSAAHIHRIGLEQVRDLQGQIDALLKAQGMTQGSISERLTALKTDPQFLWPNTDAGRQQLLDYLNAEMAGIRARMPEMFERIPAGDFLIQRVPPAIESGAPGGYARSGTLDGSRPGIYFINLVDMSALPRWTLKTLTYHEAAPGHLFESALALQSETLPLYRRTLSFSAYGEGWGLYSERLGDEAGVYQDDPFGRIGYLESFLFRASRLVVDTGIHSQGWSRERAIAFMTETLGEPYISEVERYCSAPGQACAYKLGEIVISGLRDEAQAKPDFDIKRFHTAVLGGGRLPLTVLQERVRAVMG